MAQRRMLHTRISYSRQVNSLDEFAQLLFTWMIPHLDDFGRIDGHPQTVKAIVMPLNTHSIDDFEIAIQMMVEIKLIDRYEVDGNLVIQYPNFDTYQTGLHKRTTSRYPDKDSAKLSSSEKFSEVQRNSATTEANRKELNNIKANLMEPNNATNNSSNEFAIITDPNRFQPTNEDELAAKEIWLRLEPDNARSFQTTYLWACRRGLPANSFYVFASEIEQDSSIKSNGAVFRKKVEDFLAKGRSNK